MRGRAPTTSSISRRCSGLGSWWRAGRVFPGRCWCWPASSSPGAGIVGAGAARLAFAAAAGHRRAARFQWHPLLQAVPVPGLAFTSATGLAIRHSSEGTRGRDPDPARLADSGVVATFGGSATYDIGNGEGDTWPRAARRGAARRPSGRRQSRRARLHDRRARAADGLLSREIRQGAALRGLLRGLERPAQRAHSRPRCRLCRLPHAEPGRFAEGAAHRRLQRTISPLLTVLARLVAAEVDTVRYAKDPYALPPASGSDPAQAAIFERNVRSSPPSTGRAARRRSGSGRVVNRDRLKGDGLYGWLPRVRDRDLLAVAAAVQCAAGAYGAGAGRSQ